MDWYSLAQFSVATLLVLVTPGPILAIIAHNTLRHGTTGGLMTVIGVGSGEVCLLGALFAGLSLFADLVPALLKWVSLAGVVYLVWLAANALRIGNPPARSAGRPARQPMLDGLTIALASPAALLFYAAYFPQFIHENHSVAKQVVLLTVIYVCLRSLSASVCVLAIARLRLGGCGWVTRFANLGSAALYAAIAAVSIVGVVERFDWW